MFLSFQVLLIDPGVYRQVEELSNSFKGSRVELLSLKEIAEGDELDVNNWWTTAIIKRSIYSSRCLYFVDEKLKYLFFLFDFLREMDGYHIENEINTTNNYSVIGKL